MPNGSLWLKVTKHGMEILQKSGIVNAKSLLPLTDQELLTDVAIDDLDIDRETVL